MKDTPDNEANHPYFGPCDANAPGARCFECARMRGEAPLSNDERRALTMRADCAGWAMEDAQAENRVLLVAVAALTTRALLAEARVKEMQAERDELKDLVGMQSAKIADLHKRNAVLADDNTSFEKENTAVRERLADALARIKEQQAELSEQEVGKLELIRQIFHRPI